jgi:hypothetical protein
MVQAMAVAAPAYLAGTGFTVGKGRSELAARREIELRGFRMGQAFHRDGLTVWRLEGQVRLPADQRSVAVRRTVVLEISTQDEELAPTAFAGQYPVNQLVLLALSRAAREAEKEGITKGQARIASLQYDAEKGRFRIRVEIL